MKSGMKQLTGKRKYKMRMRHITGFLAASFFSIIVIYGTLMVFIRYCLKNSDIIHIKHYNEVFAAYFICSLSVIMAFATYCFVLNKILKPIKVLSDASQKIAQGNYDIKINYQGNIAELEAAIDNFNTMARELNSVEIMRNDFVANVSHEFKTPLSSIMGYVTLLQDNTISDDERDEYIKKTFMNIEKLNDLTENILRLSKLENQNYPDEKESYRLDEQIREAIVLMEPKWDEKNICFDIELPQIIYNGNRTLIFQVWMNLIGNAIKFSNKGGTVAISSKIKEDYIRIIISDDGIGMDNDTLAHIFEKFYQGDTSRQAQGNGLGLALCKKILENCDGKIYATSEPGKGSVFMVELKNNKNNN